MLCIVYVSHSAAPALEIKRDSLAGSLPPRRRSEGLCRESDMAPSSTFIPQSSLHRVEASVVSTC